MTWTCSVLLQRQEYVRLHANTCSARYLAAGSGGGCGGGEDILFPGLLPPGERLTAASRFSQNTQSHTRQRTWESSTQGVTQQGGVQRRCLFHHGPFHSSDSLELYWYTCTNCQGLKKYIYFTFKYNVGKIIQHLHPSNQHYNVLMVNVGFFNSSSSIVIYLIYTILHIELLTYIFKSCGKTQQLSVSKLF